MSTGLAASLAKPSNVVGQRVSRAELHARIAPFAQADSFQGYKSFVLDLALYALGIAGVLFFASILGKIAGGLVAGSALVNLGSLSHEAAHRSVVRSRLGNKVIAVVSMTLHFFNYRLWIYDHHVLHHGRTNVQHNNFLSPRTLAEYRAMSPLRRAIYRTYHSQTGLGVLLYFLLERWPTVHFFPGAWLPQRHHASAWRYTALIAAYAAGLLGLVVWASAGSVIASILCALVLPYAVWFTVFSMTVFLQHTNPQLRWYRDLASVDAPPEALSVHVGMPRLINHLTHYAMEHPVHHLHAMVPHYRLKQAQAELAGISTPEIITMRFTVGNMRDVLRRCRLYDYDAHLWVDFDGEVTAVPSDAAVIRRRPAKQAAGRLLPDQADPNSPGVFFPPEAEAATKGEGATTPREDA